MVGEPFAPRLIGDVLLNRLSKTLGADAVLSLAAVGDVMVDRDDPISILEPALPVLQSADLRFCQLETAYSSLGGEGSSGPRGALGHDPSNYAVLPAAFDVVSLASNHTGDWGNEALLDCRKRLASDGLTPVGAGESLAEARTPGIVERNGIRIAFLAYCSVAPLGYYAGAPSKPGVAPLRAVTHYEAVEPDQPGTPYRTVTRCVQTDLQRMCDDIRRARENVDAVVVSMHWGIHYIRSVVAEYQFEAAHAAIDAGADAIIGHHPHKLKGVEVYDSKPIFYSVGNFAFDRVARTNLDMEFMEGAREIYQTYHQAEYSTQFSENEDAQFSMIARIEIGREGVVGAGFWPVMIDRKFRPVPVVPRTSDGRRVIEYMRLVSAEAGLPDVYEYSESSDVVGIRLA